LRRAIIENKECEVNPLKEYQIIERKPTAEELFELRQSVGWGIGEKDDYQKGGLL
jgi:hypothetical protein